MMENAMDFLDPWTTAALQPEPLIRELEKEVSDGHILFGKKVEIVARRRDTDDVLLRLSDNSGCYAVVHLTWSGKKERSPKWPITTVFSSWEEFVDKRMLPDSRG
jgi:hypothetical protein